MSDYHPLGQAILKDRDTRKIRESDAAAAKKQREAKPLSDFESARDIVEQSKDATKGWAKNQNGDCYTQGGSTAVDPAAGDTGYDYCCITDATGAAWIGFDPADVAKWNAAMRGSGWGQPLTVEQQRAQQAADYAAISAAIDAEKATFRGFSEAFAVARLEQSRANLTLQPALDEATERHRLNLRDEPRSWGELLAENKFLLGQIDGYVHRIIDLRNRLGEAE